MATRVGRPAARALPSRIGKTGIILCSHCGFATKDERLIFTHETAEGEKTEVYCGTECLKEALDIVGEIEARVADKVRDEFNLIHKQVCPRCRHRLRVLEPG